MRWITRRLAKVDRIACPWLITKFVDPQAEFVFLPADTDWRAIADGTVFDRDASWVTTERSARSTLS